MEKTFQHEIIYQIDNAATIEEVANALVANARFVREAVGVIEDCHAGLTVSNVKVRLASLSQESPFRELLTVALVLGFQEDLEAEVPDIIQALTGVDIPDQYDSMVTIFVVGVSLYGALKLVDRLMRSRPDEPSSPPSGKLKDSYQSVTNVAGDLIQVTGERVREVMEDRLGGGRSRSIAKAARDFFQPAKRHNARSIDTKTVSLDRGVIDEVPSDVDEMAFAPRQNEYDVPNVTVSLRAHNLDSEKAGWAAIVADVYQERVKLHIDPSIPAEQIFTQSEIRGDVRVYSREDESGEMVPFLYILLGVANGQPKESS